MGATPQRCRFRGPPCRSRAGRAGEQRSGGALFHMGRGSAAGAAGCPHRERGNACTGSRAVSPARRWPRPLAAGAIGATGRTAALPGVPPPFPIRGSLARPGSSWRRRRLGIGGWFRCRGWERLGSALLPRYRGGCRGGPGLGAAPAGAPGSAPLRSGLEVLIIKCYKTR